MKCKLKLKAQKAAMREAKQQDKQSRQGTRGKDKPKENLTIPFHHQDLHRRKQEMIILMKKLTVKGVTCVLVVLRMTLEFTRNEIFAVVEGGCMKVVRILVILMITDTLKSCVLCNELLDACSILCFCLYPEIYK